MRWPPCCLGCDVDVPFLAWLQFQAPRADGVGDLARGFIAHHARVLGVLSQVRGRGWTCERNDLRASLEAVVGPTDSFGRAWREWRYNLNGESVLCDPDELDP